MTSSSTSRDEYNHVKFWMKLGQNGCMKEKKTGSLNEIVYTMRQATILLSMGWECSAMFVYMAVVLSLFMIVGCEYGVFTLNACACFIGVSNCWGQSHFLHNIWRLYFELQIRRCICMQSQWEYRAIRRKNMKEQFIGKPNCFKPSRSRYDFIRTSEEWSRKETKYYAMKCSRSSVEI